MQPGTSPATANQRNASADSDLLIAGEHVIAVVHRHIIGLIAIYLAALAGIAAIIVLAVVAAPDVLSDVTVEASGLLTAIIIAVIAFLALGLLIATFIYRQSKLLLTDQSLVQITQRGLFVRKISRLSLSNVEDVTAEQRGILPSIFNYGTLVVQTGAERKNFTFSWCPDPNRYADRIIEARQRYARSLQETPLQPLQPQPQATPTQPPQQPATQNVNPPNVPPPIT